MTDNILEQLNESQRKAVLYNDGASLVIAGAGSGKTRVLTYKIAYLLQQGYRPWNILALTFTNKAAREMKDRIGRLVGAELSRSLQMGTFHSVFARILRAEAQQIGFSSNFTIYDQTDARSLVKGIVKEMGLDDKVYKPSSVSDQISMAKNHLIMPSAFVNSSLFDQKRPKVVDIYMRYVERCRQANAMDFDDLLVQTYLLFKNHDEVRRKYVERYLFVLVDEYQDTNFAQQQIVLQLTRERQRVCVVGDDAQSIYSFRGANIDNILNFSENYDNAKLFKLEQNYRSTQFIVQAANSLIRKNERQIPKDVYSMGDSGERLQLKPAYSDREEAMIVCNDIKRLRKKEKLEYADFAILYRTNSQSRTFEEQLRKEGIPYRIYGGLSFYQRKEIKDVIAYFRTVANHDDEEALKRIINYPARGIGDTTVQKIVAAATAHGVSLWTVIGQPALFGLSLARATANKLEAFKQLVDGWAQRMATEDAYTLGHAIIMESGVSKDIYSGRNPEDLSRQENLEEFLGGMQDFVESRREEGEGEHVSIGDFLQEVALLTDLDSDGDDNSPKVALMTVHAAKGLEFPAVFVVGLEENIFPSPMSTGSVRELEEERRLLYVAITRAEKHCILTCAQNRYRYGRMEYDTPSRFIRDIDPKLLVVEGAQHDEDSTTNVAYGGRQSWRQQRSDAPRSPWQQQPRPVATQFKADPMPREVAPRKEEETVKTYGLPESFKPFKSFKPHDSYESPKNFEAKKTYDAQKSLTPAAGSSASLKEGSVIEHQRFGVGTILKTEGSGDNAKATVEFRNAGTKQLLLKFAKFKVLK